MTTPNVRWRTHSTKLFKRCGIEPLRTIVCGLEPLSDGAPARGVPFPILLKSIERRSLLLCACLHDEFLVPPVASHHLQIVEILSVSLGY